MVSRCALLAEHGDVVIRAVERRAHEVRHAGVETDVVLVRVLLVEDGRDKPARITRHGTPALRADADISEPRRAHDLMIEALDTCADRGVVHRTFLRTVRDAEAAAEVDELDVDAEPLLQLSREFKHDAGSEKERLRAPLGGNDHCMQAEALHAHLTRAAIRLEHLRAREAVFRLHRLADDIVALDEIAGIVAKRQHLGQPRILCHVIEMAEIVEIDHGTEGDRLLKLIIRRIVRREHDLLARDPRRLGDDELGDAAAVRAGALLMEDLHDARVRQCLDRKMLAEARRPCEGIPQAAEIRADLRLVVDVERGRVSLDQRQSLFPAERKVFFVHMVLPQIDGSL